ncbi:MAG: hypothetical protein DRP64_05995 [Verrucomicrobia bacterium]|nr:MAG: hypothetical protein DRP64_05995 [Verrucomicrobiota bacterium]
MKVKKRTIGAIAVVAMAVALAGSVYADDGGVFLGNANPADNLWMTDGNWQFGLPTPAVTAYVTETWTSSINGPIIQSGDAAVAGNVTIGLQGWTVNPGNLAPMTMNGGTLDVAGAISIGQNGETVVDEVPGILYLNGGTLTTGAHLIIGQGSSGTVDQSGGIANVDTLGIDWFGVLEADEIGTYNLRGGELNVGVGGFHMWTHGLVDIEAGVMTIMGDIDGTIGAHIAANKILGYGGSETVLHDFNITTPGKTTVWAIPEPATLGLLGMGSLGLLAMRRFRI